MDAFGNLARSINTNANVTKWVEEIHQHKDAVAGFGELATKLGYINQEKANHSFSQLPSALAQFELLSEKANVMAAYDPRLAPAFQVAQTAVQQDPYDEKAVEDLQKVVKVLRNAYKEAIADVTKWKSDKVVGMRIKSLRPRLIVTPRQTTAFEFFKKRMNVTPQVSDSSIGLRVETQYGLGSIVECQHEHQMLVVRLDWELSDGTHATMITTSMQLQLVGGRDKTVRRKKRKRFMTGDVIQMENDVVGVLLFHNMANGLLKRPYENLVPVVVDDFGQRHTIKLAENETKAKRLKAAKTNFLRWSLWKGFKREELNEQAVKQYCKFLESKMLVKPSKDQWVALTPEEKLPFVEVKLPEDAKMSSAQAAWSLPATKESVVRHTHQYVISLLMLILILLCLSCGPCASCLTIFVTISLPQYVGTLVRQREGTIPQNGATGPRQGA